MALVSATLQSALLRTFSNPPKDPAEAAKQFAKAYKDYTIPVNAGASVPTFLGTEELGARTQFVRLTGNPNAGSPALFASIWQAAIDAYWLTSPAPVFFTGASTGPTQPALGAAVFIPAMISAVSVYQAPASAAARIASAVDAYTRTFAAFLTPPGSPVPFT